MIANKGTHAIMQLLENNPRMKLTQMSKKLNIPMSTLYDRIKKIEKEYRLVGTWLNKR